jgi:hypothetical protein
MDTMLSDRLQTVHFAMLRKLALRCQNMSLLCFRKVIAPFVLVGLVGVFVCSSPGTVIAEERKEISASDLIRMMGVNVHMRYTDGAYNNLRNVLQALQYLGIKNIRDHMPGTDSQADMQARDALRRMAFDGIRFDLVYSNGWKQSQATELLRNLEKAVPGSVEFVEGYNEINNFPVTYDGLSGAEGAAAGQRALYRAISEEPNLKHIRIIDMTGIEEIKDTTFSRGSSLEGYADVMNVHVYAQNGQQPGVWINPKKIGAYKSIEQPLAKAITEFGYSSMPQSGWLVIGVDERTQAKGLLNGIFDAARSGYEKLYTYELLDQKPDPQGKELEFHFGLFTFDNRPKLSAQVIRNLMHVLGSSDSEVRQSGRQGSLGISSPASRAPLIVQHANDDEKIHTLSIAKSDGNVLAAVWRESSFWDRANGKPLVASGVRADVSFEKSCGVVKVYDVLESSEPVLVSHEDTSSLVVGDHVQLVECAHP